MAFLELPELQTLEVVAVAVVMAVRLEVPEALAWSFLSTQTPRRSQWARDSLLQPIQFQFQVIKLRRLPPELVQLALVKD